MKKLMFVVLLLLNTVAMSELLGYYNDLSGENSDAVIPQNSWYWDPNQSGWGFGISVQRSQMGNSGYLVHGAFYTHKEDGSQAWYTVQGEYVPNPDVNAWRETPAMYGTQWGNNNAWMGKVESQLAETSGGMPLGEDWRPNDAFAVGDIKIIWRNPDVVEIYLDGATEPDHVLERFSMYGDLKKGDAGYLSKNIYRMIGMRNYISGQYDTPKAEYIQSTMSFNQFNPDDFFDHDAYGKAGFLDVIDAGGDKQYFISSRPVGNLTAQYMASGSEYILGRWDKKLFDHGLPDYIIMVYDREKKQLNGYIARGVQKDAPERGLIVDLNGYRFSGHLPPEDQGRISLHPSKCVSSRCGSGASFTKELTRRSVWHFFKVPDDTGMLHERIADTYERNFGNG